MSFKELQKELEKDPQYRKEDCKIDLLFEISFLVQEIRAKKGITIKQLSKKIGFSRKYIDKIEKGMEFPTKEFLEKIDKITN